MTIVKKPNDFRVEKDTMGEIKVPGWALYGAQTQRAVENFGISGLKPRPAFIWSVAVIKKAASAVNSELGLLSPVIANAIQKAAQEVIDGKWVEQFVVDPFQAGAGTSHHMNVNEVLASRASQMLSNENKPVLVHPNDHVNMAQSTNDVIPAAIRLGCLWRLDELNSALSSLAGALSRKSVEFDDIVKSGRTHLQDAVPVRLGQEFHAYSTAVERDTLRINRSAEGLLRLGIGGTATGTGLNAHPDYAEKMISVIGEITGFDLIKSDDLFEVMQSGADFADFSASLRTTAITLTRIANDFRLLSSGPSSGLDEIRLPAVQPGSSIMPGKVNPVMAEMLNMAMIQVIALDSAVNQAAAAGQLELNVMLPLIAYNLFEMMHIMINSINNFTVRCVEGITANPEKCSFWLERNTIMVTALNPLIGYQASAQVAHEAVEKHLTILGSAKSLIDRGELKRLDGSPVSMDEIQSALSSIGQLTRGGLK
jgi:fumarate hydratase class II